MVTVACARIGHGGALATSKERTDQGDSGKHERETRSRAFACVLRRSIPARLAHGSAASTSAQPRDHLAAEQVEHVRSEEVAEVVGDAEITRAAPHLADDLFRRTDQGA